MQDKYNSLKKELSKESTYQMLVEPRNKECAKRGATQYTVVNSIAVESNGQKKDCPLFYDSDEFYNLNDPTDDDTWGGQTTTAIYTINTLETSDSLKRVVAENKQKQQLKDAIDALESGDNPGELSITGVSYAIDAQETITLTLSGSNLEETETYQWSIKVDEEAVVEKTSTGTALEIAADTDLNTSIQAGDNVTVIVSVGDYTSDELTVSKS